MEKKKRIDAALLVIVVVASVALVGSIVNFQNSEAQMDIISPGVVPDLEVEELAEEENNNAATATTTTTSSEAATNETSTTAAASGTNNNITEIRFLATQTAQSGTLSQINATTYTLELRNVSDKTILFSDRPNRIVTSQSTSDFIGNWSLGEVSFAVDPPNAVLVLDEEEGRQQHITIIELFNPEYDTTTNTLKYDITSENATSSIDLPHEFGQSTLVIDDEICDPCADPECADVDGDLGCQCF
ncbi:MAG TPA: hypothetical protein VE544_13300 [Nitrososphaeraceae archaeon]|jgi:hypothetical protein|nr:hypothetical protein [Nitrososphaeraceae archaeon]